MPRPVDKVIGKSKVAEPYDLNQRAAARNTRSPGLHKEQPMASPGQFSSELRPGLCPVGPVPKRGAEEDEIHSYRGIKRLTSRPIPITGPNQSSYLLISLCCSSAVSCSS